MAVVFEEQARSSIAVNKLLPRDRSSMTRARSPLGHVGRALAQHLDSRTRPQALHRSSGCLQGRMYR